MGSTPESPVRHARTATPRTPAPPGAHATDSYPDLPGERTRWILDRRPPRPSIDPWQAIGAFVETEPDELLRPVATASLLLASRECPWKCVFCDLWRHTSPSPIPVGAVPNQIRSALATCALPPRPAPARIKLYNSGSFFDPQAVPAADYPAIAGQLARFERVIVECHPRLVGPSAVRFRDLLDSTLLPRTAHPLEVALGLETAHEPTLQRLNKRVTLADIRQSARFLEIHQIALRVFLLLHPPFLDDAVANRWLSHSIDTAFDLGATAVSLIPTRVGNGSLDALQRTGQFHEPSLATIEQTLERERPRHRGRLFVDLWDIARFAPCAVCAPNRIRRLHQHNLTQQLPPPPPPCPACGEPTMPSCA